jgi:hypothetical protein
MAGTRRVEFDGPAILQLLVHYMQDHDERIPLDSELVSAGVSRFINRWIGLTVRSDKWGEVKKDPNGTPRPLFFRYEGRKTLSWSQDSEQHTADSWQDAVEAPTSSVG